MTTMINTSGVNRTVSDWRTMKDATGAPVEFPSEIEVHTAGGAVGANLVVALAVPSSATVGPRTAVGSGTTLVRNIGISRNAAAAALDKQTVVTRGLAFGTSSAAITAGAPVAATTDGKLVAATLDASAVVGAVVGFALQAATDADEVIAVYVCLR